MTKLSIIIPVYFNEGNLIPLYKDMEEKVLKILDCNYEIVFIDDGSADNSYSVLCELQKNHSHIKIVKLSRNFGSHSAILAGFSYCTGDAAVIKAADLQEPSELILDMYESWKKGNKVVLAVREGREESVGTKIFAKAYYGLTRKFALPDMPKGGFDCCLIDRKVIKALDMMDEKNTSIMGQILWCGFKRDVIYYVRKAREIGTSKWTLKKKLNLVYDTLFGFSYAPIKFLTIIGTIFALVAVIWGIVILISRIAGSIDVTGWTAMMLLILFSSGLILFGMGIIGEYLWRTFDAARNRPPYIVDEVRDEGE